MCKIVRRIFSSLQNVNTIAVPCDAGIKAQYSEFERELRYWQIRIVGKTSAATTKLIEIAALIVYKEREARNVYRERETLATG
jgi:hypothetical protein